MSFVQEGVTLQSGVAQRKWGFRGDGRGTGRLSPVHKWKYGVSGKTNNAVNFPVADAEEVVSIIY